jgi:predicted nucleotidyltransferase component of viral defense system
MNDDPALVQSIRQRLENHARKSGQDIQRTLVRYALERLLYRLSISDHRDRFILKGAMLFSVWDGAPFRATGDLDLLGNGPNTEEALAKVFREICAIKVAEPDGLNFNTDAINTAQLRLATDYSGVALRFDAMLGRARLRMQVDIGFGDAVIPEPMDVKFPTILHMPAPNLRAYPPETVIAEKLEAMVSLGVATTRIKDFFDVWAISQSFDFESPTLIAALKATFNRRGTIIPASEPVALSDLFARDADKQRLWAAFASDRIDATAAPQDLTGLITEIRMFTTPLLAAIANDGPRMRWDCRAGKWL